MIAAVVGKIHQNVYPVGPDLPGQPLVTQSVHFAPEVGEGFHPRCHAIESDQVAITGDAQLFAVVRFQHRQQEARHAMAEEVCRKLADPQRAVRRGIIGVLGRRRRGIGIAARPTAVRGVDLDWVHLRQVIQAEDEQ